MSKENNHYIVAVGASAGGLEAIEELFSNIPPDTGMSFIVIQHLSPDYKSLMVELLSKKTNMKVFRAENEMPIEQNCVYLIPPKMNMTVFHNKLLLTEQDLGRGLNLPIDIFFKSLAKDAAEKAICIILSGSGSDGSSGLREIKENGGLIVVQDPETAQFDSMPNSAINTGLVDFILSPADIAEKIFAYVNAPPINLADKAKLFSSSQDGLLRIFALIREKHEIDYSHYKMSTMVRRIERRMSLNQIGNMNDYVKYLENNSNEVSILYRELLIGVTSFFRDHQAFSIMKKDIIPQLLDKNEDHIVRIWVTGCSTGEEAYSIAILCHEYLIKTGNRAQVKIFATDVDQDAIIKAGNGTYTDSIVSDIDEEILNKYFIKQDNTFKITRTIREMVVFAKHNLVKDPPFPNIDLVTCRNLLIYLQPSLQNKVFQLFNYSLNAGGFLFLGSSESLGDYSEYFSTINLKWKIYKSRGRMSHIDINRFSIPVKKKSEYFIDAKNNYIFQGKRDENRMLSRFLDNAQKKYLPFSILFNTQGEILHIVGDSSKFLKFPAGKITNQLSKLLPKDLEIPALTAIQKLFIKNEDIIYNNVAVEINGTKEIYNLIFTQLEGKSHQVPFGAIYFEKVENPLVFKDAKEANFLNINEQAEQRIIDLEQELQFTKENLQAAIEELETSNEELQAANEELLASNEELQSTNEELQSVNEELHTVNSEHQNKILELTMVNNDIENLINSLQLAVLFFDDNLELRKHTPKAKEILKIRENDIGRTYRQILDKRYNIDLCQLIEQVKDTGESLAIEFSFDAKYYIAGIRPYLISEKLQSGVTLSLAEITKLHGIEERLFRSELWLKETEKVAKIGAWEIILGNMEVNITEAVYEIYGITNNHKIDIDVLSRFYTERDKKKFKRAIDNCIKKGKEFDLILNLVSAHGEYKKIRLLGEADKKNNSIIRVFGVIKDISEIYGYQEKLENMKKNTNSLEKIISKKITYLDNSEKEEFNSILKSKNTKEK
ncbi:MAG: chemotaxis protein CheR [Ignavibacteriae bacterium]|nr:MAG: chemotaxis protein CheR [Ignavibacteriota bacterium]